MQRHEKKIYVLGHKNPDTDSIVSAAAYAALKQAQGAENCVAARAGMASPQAEYVFHRFGVPLPEFVPDLVPKVAYYYNPDVKTIATGVSLWEAMALMQDSESRIMPVVDADGRYHSLLHNSHIAKKLLQLCNPRQKTAIQTSVELLASVLSAQALVLRNEREVKKSLIVIAATDYERFTEFLGSHIPESTIVICGERPDVQRHAVERGVRALIVTNGKMVDREIRDLAEERDVSILVSPYDTSSTTLLLIYSMPVFCMANADMKPLNLNDSARKAIPLLSTAPGKSLPVVDDDGAVVGVVSENDLFREANLEVIMVDHNEPTQAVEGLENYRILEIIDHHRLGTLSTSYPITFINKPVGATSTIVAELYQEHRVPLTAPLASILLCGILADTLALQSATTTLRDHEMAEYLANLVNLDIDRLGAEIMKAASNIAGRTAEELVRQDMKTYNEGGHSFTVSQIEVGDLHEALGRKQEFLGLLEAERASRGSLFCALLVTDVIELTSLLLLAADPRFAQCVALPRREDGVYIMRGVVSRKKQVLPVLSELIEKFRAG